MHAQDLVGLPGGKYSIGGGVRQRELPSKSSLLLSVAGVFVYREGA